jgi:Flp pilus assembly protein TadD
VAIWLSQGSEALGAILFRERKYAEAQQVLEKAIALDPSSVRAHYQFGMLLARLGQREESDRQLKVYKELEAAQKKTYVDKRRQ